MDSQRRELIEVLDRLVAYEHYYRSVYGHFTKLISRLGYPIPPGLSEIYDIRVTEASKDRLTLSALSEINGKTQDLVTVDQDYEVHSSFVMPVPRPEYLKSLALKQMRALRDAPAGQSIEESGVFRGYFRYEQRRDSRDRKIAQAIGLKPPVLGFELELGDQEVADQEVASESEGKPASPPAVGQNSAAHVMSTMEEAYLAQRIFHAEVGRYARNWSELSKIASFRFEDKEKFGQNDQVPFGDAESVLEIDARELPKVDKISHNSMRVPSSALDPVPPLEVEALGPETQGDVN